jgi:hypothetical protein
MRRRNNKGQVSVQFHWIFIIIAGAIILAFFVGVVFKQKAVSEQKIATAIVSDLEPIIAGAGVSEDAFNIVDIPKTDIQFICSGDYSAYTIPKTAMGDIPLSTDVIFSPDLVEGKRLYIWTLSWQMPFRVMNFLMITSPNIRYEFVYDNNLLDYAYQIYDDMPSAINKDIWQIGELDDIENLGFDKTRFVFITENAQDVRCPRNFRNLGEDDVSAVMISFDEIRFYKKGITDFTGDPGAVRINEGFTEKNPMVYGAIFSWNKEMYDCNVRKAFRRLAVVANILKDRTEAVRNYYTSQEICYGLLDVGAGDLEGLWQAAARSDFDEAYSAAWNILDLNDRLLKQDCILVY